MIFDKTGSLANTKRHDYLPFGEELFAGVGGRTTANGYSGDSVRQKFTEQERDNETGLDYFVARYYSQTQGRFTSVDPDGAGAEASDPQTWNGYTYALNNPLKFTDPLGLKVVCKINGEIASCDDVLKNIKEGNFASTTYTVNGVSHTVRRSDFVTLTQTQRPDGTLVTTEAFNQSGFLKAAAGLATLVQSALSEGPEIPIGSEGRGSFGGGGAGGSWQCCQSEFKYVRNAKHGPQARGNISAAPRNGQAALDNSVAVKPTSTARVGIDYNTGEFVGFRDTGLTVKGEFHGYVVSWPALPNEMKMR